jgi:AraC-type DNA-binding domain-containing proteins
MGKAVHKNVDVKDKTEPHQYIKIAEFRKNVRKTVPHKHNNYFEFVFLVRGSGSHTIDGRAYIVNPPVLFVIRREQVHHWELDGEPEGYVLIIKKQFIDDCVDKALKELLSGMSGHSGLYLEDAAPVAALFGLLLAEWQKPAHGNVAVTEGLLKALLGIALQQAPYPRKPSGTKADIYQRFEELLRHTDTLHNSVAHYALLLNTTPQNLNAVCRRATGEPAASVLAAHLLAEAKRLLLYTDFTVGQIAVRLNFKDGSHFIKYFRRHIGSTPHAFRQLA